MATELPEWAVRIRDARRSKCWTQRDMARRLAEVADEETRARLPDRASVIRRIKSYESGAHMPGDPYRMLYARALGMDEMELFGEPKMDELGTQVETLKRLLTKDDSSNGPRIGRKIGQSTVSDLSARVHRLRLADSTVAGGDLIHTAYNELGNAVQLYKNTTHTTEVGRRMLSIVAEFSQIAGWIASDAGRNTLAERTYQLGISAAREAGDRSLEGNIIGSLSYQMASLGYGKTAVDLALQGVEAGEDVTCPRAQALALDRLAWAYSKVGDDQGVMRALGMAADAMSHHGAESEPRYVYWLDENEMLVMEARTQTELGKPHRAVPILTDVLSRYDTTHTRELALYLSWLAVALVDSGEPVGATEVAWRMFDISTSMPSERVMVRQRVVLERLRRYRDVAEVRDLIDSYAHI